MKRKLKRVKAIEIKKVKGLEEITINLSADAANADWIRASRVLKEGKKEDLDELENTQMYYESDEEE